MTPLESATQVWRQAVRVLLLQAVLAALAALIATILWDFSAGGWALAGGAVCLAPSALFAFELSRAAKRSGGAFGVALVLGELVKVVLVMALFVLAYTRFGGVNAAALLLGFVAAIQGYFLALLVT
ncbi:MAG: ATP synthase subunit I [Betaproteobacteria bacterium]|nr:ATP synthase subunit I [Betaproteobacteria bacterium]